MLAIGGGMLMPRDSAPLQVKYAMELTGRPRPKLCVLNTAVGDDPNAYLRVYDRLAETPPGSGTWRCSRCRTSPTPRTC